MLSQFPATISWAMIQLDEFFVGQDRSRRLFDAVLTMVNSIGPVNVSVKKSQVSFRRKKAFAWVWLPGRYLRGTHAPLVLSLALHARDPSLRWKEIVEPYPGRFMHHLEVYSPEEIDGEVLGWLQNAWDVAG